MCIRDSYIGALGAIIFLVVIIEAFMRKRKTSNNPWGVEDNTLEWSVSSPPAFHTFEKIPSVRQVNFGAASLNTKTFTNNLDNGIKFRNSPTDYLILMKPRVMSLVVFTAFVGYFVGLSDNIEHLNPILATIGIFAIAIGAGASGALNQWLSLIHI